MCVLVLEHCPTCLYFLESFPARLWAAAKASPPREEIGHHCCKNAGGTPVRTCWRRILILLEDLSTNNISASMYLWWPAFISVLAANQRSGCGASSSSQERLLLSLALFTLLQRIKDLGLFCSVTRLRRRSARRCAAGRPSYGDRTRPHLPW